MRQRQSKMLYFSKDPAIYTNRRIWRFLKGISESPASCVVDRPLRGRFSKAHRAQRTDFISGVHPLGNRARSARSTFCVSVILLRKTIKRSIFQSCPQLRLAAAERQCGFPPPTRPAPPTPLPPRYWVCGRSGKAPGEEMAAFGSDS